MERILLQLIKRVSVLAILAFPLYSYGQSETERLNETNQSEPNNEGSARFITDKLYTFLHAGPGRNYRILGSIQSGSKVTQLKVDAESSFIEIVDDKERRGWVDGRHIVTQETIHARLPVLEQQLAFSGEQLVAQQNKIDELNQVIESLEKNKSNLEDQYSKLQRDYNELQQKLSKNADSEKQDRLIKGGLLALGSVLLGVLLTLVLKRRRRNDYLM